MQRHINIPVFVPHNGCKNDCSFCNQRKITGVSTEVTRADIETIISQSLQTINKADTFVEVAFFGGSFTGIDTCKQIEFLSVAKSYLDKGLIDGIRLSTRPDYIDAAVLDRLKFYGVTTIELGAQSMDNEVLLINNRNHTAEDTIKASSLIKEYGFDLGLQMMVGLLGDTKEKSVATALKIAELEPRCVRIYPTLVIKETKLAEWFLSGKYIPLSIDEAVDICKEIKKIFDEKNIEIIRLGLMSSENINTDNDVLAGPCHASFGELVESEIIFDRLKELARTNVMTEIYVNPKLQSKLVGNKRKNIVRLENELKHKMKIIQDSELDLKHIRIKGEKICI